MPKLIDLEGVGLVEFPDDASSDEILQFSETLTQGRLKSAAKNFARGAVDTFGSMEKGMGIVNAHTLSKPSPYNALIRQFNQAQTGMAEPPATQTPAYRSGQALQEGAAEAYDANPRFQNEFWTSKVPQGVGSTLAFAAAAPAGGLGVATAGALASGASAYDEAKAAGADDETANTAFFYNALAGTSEAVPLGRILGRLDKISGGRLKTAFVNAVKGGAEEGSQEAFQQLVQNLVAKKTYDKDRKYMQDVGINALVGVVTGGALSGAGSAAEAGLDRMTRKPAEQQAQPQPVGAPFISETGIMDVNLSPLESEQSGSAAEPAPAPAASTAVDLADLQATMQANTVQPVGTPAYVAATDEQAAPAKPEPKKAEPVKPAMDTTAVDTSGVVTAVDQFLTNTRGSRMTREELEDLQAALDENFGQKEVTPNEETQGSQEGQVLAEPAQPAPVPEAPGAGVAATTNSDQISSKLGVQEAGNETQTAPAQAATSTLAKRQDEAGREGERPSVSEPAPPTPASKPPEQMTPEEYHKQAEIEERYPGAIANRFRHDDAQKKLVAQSLKKGLPVSSAAVDAYGIKLPAGYVREGDLYVYRPAKEVHHETQTAPAQAAAQTATAAAAQGEAKVAPAPASDAQAAGQVGGVQDKPVAAKTNIQILDEGVSSAAAEANNAVQEWGKHATEVLEPLVKQERELDSQLFLMRADAEIAKTGKGKKKITMKALLAKYGAKTKDELNERYKGMYQQFTNLQERIETETARQKELARKKELAAKNWSKAASRLQDAKASNDRIDATLTKIIDVLKDDPNSLKAVTPLWFGKEMVRATFVVIRAAWRAGKTAAEAIQAGIDYVKSLNLQGYNEPELRKFLESQMIQDSRSKTLDTQVLKDTGRLEDARKEAESALGGSSPELAMDELEKATVQGDKGGLSSAAQIAGINVVRQKLEQQLRDAKTPAERDAALEQLDRLGNLIAAQASHARGAGLGDMKLLADNAHLAPVLAFRQLVKDKWKRILGTDKPTEAVEDVVDKAGKDATSDVSVVKLLNAAAKAEGIDWKDLFLDNPIATQIERRKHLLAQILNDPRFAGISRQDAIKLEQQVSTAWERARLKVIEGQLKKLVTIPKGKSDVLEKRLLPELIRAANAGTLNTAQLRDWLASQFGLPELSGATAQRLIELSQKAQDEPNGVRRATVLQEMRRILEDTGDFSWADLVPNAWYASVLASPRTIGFSVAASSMVTGITQAVAAAAERAATMHPVQAMRVLSQFFSAIPEAITTGAEIVRSNNLALIPGYEQHLEALLSPTGHRTQDTFEKLKRRGGVVGNTLGLGAYTKRLMTAADFRTGTRAAMLYYATMLRGDQKSIDAINRKFDRKETARAWQQAKTELPDAGRAAQRVRAREILEEGVAYELVQAAQYAAERAAANASDIPGIPGLLYTTLNSMTAWGEKHGVPKPVLFMAKAAAGAGFFRAAMNVMSNALAYAPVAGTFAALRGEMAKAPEGSLLNKMSVAYSPEQLRLMWAAQGLAAVAGIGLAAAVLGPDDEDKPIELTGGWRNLTPNERKKLMAAGEMPWGVRVGNTWISYRNFPFAPVLAMVGSMRDRQRFSGQTYTEESAVMNVLNGWLNGMMFVKDISALSGMTAIFGGNAWQTEDNPSGSVNKSAAQAIGGFASGYVPTFIKDIDNFLDPSLYRPDNKEYLAWWYKNMPFVRRQIGEGPVLNQLGEPVEQVRPPLRGWISLEKDSKLWNVLANQMSQGVFIPQAGETAAVVQGGVRRQMTPAEKYRYEKAYGAGAKRLIEANLDAFAAMTPAQAEKWFKSFRWDQVREQARRKALSGQ